MNLLVICLLARHQQLLQLGLSERCALQRFTNSRGRPAAQDQTSHARPLLLAAPAVDALAWAWEAAVGGGGGPLVGGFHAAALPRRFSAKPRTAPNDSNGVARGK